MEAVRLTAVSYTHLKEESEPFIPVDEIISAKTFLIPNKDTKVVSTILNFKNIDAIDYLMVRESGGNSYSVKIDRNELTADYVFNYVVQKLSLIHI